MKHRTLKVTLCSLLLAVPLAAGQTFEIEGQPTRPAAQRSGKTSKSTAQSEGFGWGSSIEVGRLSRAAEQALARGQVAQAADYAQRAVNAAPRNNRLWFLLGYAARLAGRYQQSIDAYNHGLRNDPSSVEGLSGLAQTYMRLGKSSEARQLLMRVIAASPRRPVDLMMAGELFLQAGELQRGADLLERSEAMQPSVHTEVLLATAYIKLKQPQKAKQLLDRARSRGGKNADVFRAVANYYREQRDYKSAIETLEQIPRKTPDLLAEIGYTYMLAGDKKNAAETYVKAADQAPKDVKTQVSAAQALVAHGNFGGAEKYLARAASLGPNYYRLHAVRADIARTQKQEQDAIKEYNLAIANLPPGGPPEGVLYPIQLRLDLAEQYRNAGQEANAMQQVSLAEAQLNQLDIQGPPRAQFLGMRASVFTAAGNYEAADKDLTDAHAFDPNNINLIIQHAALLWKMKRPDDARKLFNAALDKEPNNRFALESLGYLARDVGDNKTAETFFKKLQAACPDDYVSYLALGDLYTALRRFPDAQQNYEAAFKLASNNGQIIAGAANAAIEAHQLVLAGRWLDRAQGAVKDDPRVMLQQERYLFHRGKYLESTQYALKVLEKMPTSRDGSVYLAYNYYNLGRYDDSLALARKYQSILPKEPNFPLIAGHSEKQAQLLPEAVEDYTRAIAIDPNLEQAYINRGYVLNDLQNAEAAARDFQHVLKVSPQNGVARLGLSFSCLQLRKGKQALEEATLAQKILGENGSTHLALAGAYRQMRLLADAEREYRAALKFAPKDLTLHLALADTLYSLRRYNDSAGILKDALALSPNDPFIYGKLAHAYAHLHDRDMTLRYVQAAEQGNPDSSAILLDTGDALLTLGDREAAMERFARALEAPDANRVDARLLIAKLMARDRHWDDARQQISLAFAEARIGEASPVTTENLIAAANLFLYMHEFDLAQQYFEKARQAGAADQVVAIGLANTYLAQGEHLQAEAQLASLGSRDDHASDYDYTLALANVYRERRDTVRALALFARASSLGGEDETAQRALREVAGEEGFRINQKFSFSSSLRFAPLFDDQTVYTTFAQINDAAPGELPPHSLLETRWINAYRVHQGNLPTITGSFQVRNARGTMAVPSALRVLSLNTYDYILNGGVNPIWHFGRNTISLNPGIALTFRRDRESPVQINQDLFRQFLYMQTSPFWNWMSIRGTAMHESGGFTQQRLSSRDLYASLDFTVGRPWGRTAFLTGYNVRQFLLSPRSIEWYQTSSYVGLQRRFGQDLTVAGLAEYIRGWAVRNRRWANAQAIRPAVQVRYTFKRDWEFNGSLAFSRGQGLHDYDNMQSGFFISYVKSLRHHLRDGSEQVPVEYPLRFSVGLEQQQFFNFTGRGQAQWRPVIRLTFF
ncbi:MAG: tetratricopeptide repeat protein [Terriglobales bacterium]